MGELSKAITTQEELDEIISGRVNRVNEKYKGYISPEDHQKALDGFKDYVSPEDHQKALDGFKDYVSPEDYQEKVSSYETNSVKMRIAYEEGLPLSIVDRLKGSTEKEIREDAKLFSGLAKKRTAPTASGDEVITEKQAKQIKLDNAYKKLLSE